MTGKKPILSAKIAIKGSEEKTKKLKEPLFDSDDNFYFIAGYTNWGFPYGITWEEAELDNLIENDVGI